MALSPVVTHVAESAQKEKLGSPLKNLSSAKTSSNSTPRPASNAAAPTKTVMPPPQLDLAEQMNEEEKRKYIKGRTRKIPLPRPTSRTD